MDTKIYIIAACVGFVCLLIGHLIGYKIGRKRQVPKELSNLLFLIYDPTKSPNFPDIAQETIIGAVYENEDIDKIIPIPFEMDEEGYSDDTGS